MLNEYIVIVEHHLKASWINTCVQIYSILYIHVFTGLVRYLEAVRLNEQHSVIVTHYSSPETVRPVKKDMCEHMNSSNGPTWKKTCVFYITLEAKLD